MNLSKNRFEISAEGKKITWTKINEQGEIIDQAETVLTFPVEFLKPNYPFLSVKKIKEHIVVPDIVLPLLFPKDVLSIQKTRDRLQIHFEQIYSRHEDIIDFYFHRDDHEIVWNNYAKKLENRICCKESKKQTIFYIPLEFIIQHTKHYDISLQKKLRIIRIFEKDMCVNNYKITSSIFPIVIPHDLEIE